MTPNIKDFPKYHITEHGNVVNLVTRRIRIATKCGKSSYFSVDLYHNGYMKRLSIHRLVALAYIPNPEGKPQVNHVDGDKTNNNAENLEWCTASENTIHAHSNGLVNTPRAEESYMFGKRNHEVHNSREVVAIYPDGREIEFPSAREALRLGYATQVSQICAVAKGNRKTHNNLVWRYKNEDREI